MNVSSGGRTFDVCFITTTWRGDLDRFEILRQSLVAYGHGAVPHYALVNTEDVPLLESLKLPGVIAVPSRDLLSPEVETLRLKYLKARGGRRWKTLMRSLNRRLGWFPSARYYGWQIQQLLKLKAPTELPHDVFVCFDSDNVICGNFKLDDFVPDGKVMLHERRIELTAESKPWSWYPHACQLLDVPVPAGYQLDYVNQPVVFEKRAVAGLQAWLEKRYGRAWFEPLVDQPLGQWSEFMTYGVFVREHLKLKGFEIGTTNAENMWISTEAQRRNADALIQKAFEDPKIKLLVLQADHHGHWPVSRFVPTLRRHLDLVGGQSVPKPSSSAARPLY